VLLSVLKKIFFRQVDEREQIMYLMIGLGNPGSRYARTRHNIGFMVLEKIAAQWKISLTQKSFDALWNRGKINNVSVLLAMPQTYMNLSGKSVGRLMAYYKVDIDHVIVIHDDLDLPFGTIRLKKGGGDAGHKGLKSVVTALGSADFLRIRMGIGKPADKAGIENYVLQMFNQEEQVLLPESIQLAAEAAAEIVVSGRQQVMAKYHTKNISNLKKEDG